VNPQVISTIFAALNASNELQMRGDTDLSNFSACISESLELAKSCATKLDVRLESNNFTSKLTLKGGASEYIVIISAIRTSDKITVEQMIEISKK
jgi:hypothetical protein